eukprot:COSAG03_NODE_446_length_7847_cov_4.635777_12_plen_75_part_00
MSTARTFVSCNSQQSSKRPADTKSAWHRQTSIAGKGVHATGYTGCRTLFAWCPYPVLNSDSVIQHWNSLAHGWR